MPEKDDVRLQLEAAQAPQEDGSGEVSQVSDIPVGGSKLKNGRPDNDDELEITVDAETNLPQKREAGADHPKMHNRNPVPSVCYTYLDYA
jgi:hypothetical protein